MRCAAAAAVVAVLLVLVAAGAGAAAEAGGPGPTCDRRVGPPFLDALGSRCPRARIEPSPPLEVPVLPSSATYSRPDRTLTPYSPS